MQWDADSCHSRLPDSLVLCDNIALEAKSDCWRVNENTVSWIILNDEYIIIRKSFYSSPLTDIIVWID